MGSFRIQSALVASASLLLIALIPNAAGLKCYQCFYADDIPGVDFGGVAFGKSCQSGKDFPDKWSVECDTSSEANNTCANAQGTFATLKVSVRGCFPKGLVPADGKCDPNSLKTVVDFITSGFLNGTEVPGLTGSLNTCYCDDKDNCNPANTLVSSFLLLPIPIILAIHKGTLSI